MAGINGIVGVIMAGIEGAVGVIMAGIDGIVGIIRAGAVGGMMAGMLILMAVFVLSQLLTF